MTDDVDATTTRPWWRDAVVYQIYPRSFADSNGDIVLCHTSDQHRSCS